MADLHCYNIDDCDTVVAADVEDAWKVWAEYLGCDVDTALEDHPDVEPEQIDDTAIIKVWCDADSNPDEIEGDKSRLTAKTAGEWAAKQGRGLLCSTEH